MPRDVFISYNSKDKATVRRLAAGLQARGLSCWYDEWEIPTFSGTDGEWVDALETLAAGIKDSRCLVVLLGEHGAGPWETKEWRTFWLDKPLDAIIPVRLPGGSKRHASVPGALQDRDWFDLASALSEEEMVDQLFHRVSAVIATALDGRPVESEVGEEEPPERVEAATPTRCPQCQARGSVSFTERRLSGELIGGTIVCKSCRKSWQLARFTSYPLGAIECPECGSKEPTEIEPEGQVRLMCFTCGTAINDDEARTLELEREERNATEEERLLREDERRVSDGVGDVGCLWPTLTVGSLALAVSYLVFRRTRVWEAIQPHHQALACFPAVTVAYITCKGLYYEYSASGLTWLAFKWYCKDKIVLLLLGYLSFGGLLSATVFVGVGEQWYGKLLIALRALALLKIHYSYYSKHLGHEEQRRLGFPDRTIAFKIPTGAYNLVRLWCAVGVIDSLLTLLFD